jgi:drug/metabolite transporter (DMT)-like permease
MGTGELAGLSAAALWACASVFYGRTRLSAWQINFGKNFIAAVILCLHLAIVTGLAGQSMFAADRNTWLLLSVSSIVGIIIGDTFYFRSLQILGPQRALIVSMTSPVFATVVGWVVLKESLSLLSLTGIATTLAGVAVVISERGAASEIPGHFPGTLSRGIAMGLLAAICNAGGGTFNRLGTHGSESWNASGCDPLEATVIRVCIASALSIVAAVVTGTLMSTARQSFAPSALRNYLPAVICGPWLGIWMSQIAYKNSFLAVTLTLTCTTPLFVMPILRIMYGTRITLRGILGALMALAGVYCTVTG